MINRVKSLSSVEQKEDTTIIFDDGLMKELVNGDDVLSTVLSCQKPPLRGLNKRVDRRHDPPSHHCRKNAVIGVSNAERSGVREEAGILLGKKVEETVVETVRGDTSVRDSVEDIE